MIIFEDDTPLNLIKQVQPDIIVKGGDYQEQDVVGAEYAQVVLFNFIDGYSTTKIVQRSSNR